MRLFNALVIPANAGIQDATRPRRLAGLANTPRRRAHACKFHAARGVLDARVREHDKPASFVQGGPAFFERTRPA
jgi:hypothetical protein